MRVALLTPASPIGLLTGLVLVVLVLAALMLAALMLAALRVLAAGLARAAILVALGSLTVLRFAL
ncbi:MAG TPA: hypothetical protein VGL87_10910 [Steroidobacteraceae bacterium]